MSFPPGSSAGVVAGPARGLGRVPTAVRIGYGVGNVAYSLPYQATATFFIFYATAILRIPAAAAGAAIAASARWDAITDPAVGYLSTTRRAGASDAAIRTSSSEAC